MASAAAVLNFLSVFFLISSLLNVTVFSAAGGGAPLAKRFCSKTVSPDYCTYCFFKEMVPGGGRADDNSTPADLGYLAIGCMMKETGVFQRLLNRYTTDHNLDLRQRAVLCVSLMNDVLDDLRAAGWTLGLRRFREAVSRVQIAKLDLHRCTDLFDGRYKIPKNLNEDLLKIEAYAANTPEILAQINR